METVHHQEFRSRDPDEAHEWLRKTYADHNVKISGNSKEFAFSCSLTQLAGMSVGSLTHTMETEVDVLHGLPDLTIVEHRDGAALQLSVGTETVSLREAECFLLPADRAYRASFNSIGVRVTTLSLLGLQRDAAGRLDHDRVDIDFSRPVTPAAGRQWSQTIQYVEGLVSNSTLLATAPLARRQLAWLINSAVLACFPNSTLDAETPTYAGDTPQPLRRALGFIDEHVSDPITLSEIATAARLSPRGLQAAFRRHLDTTPLAHLRSVRMDRAHSDLQSADQSEGVSVAAVAARWGFTHLGRFAIEYRRRFGVYPSQTLRGRVAP